MTFEINVGQYTCLNTRYRFKMRNSAEATAFSVIRLADGGELPGSWFNLVISSLFPVRDFGGFS
jgi:hypothetical protein